MHHLATIHAGESDKLLISAARHVSTSCTSKSCREQTTSLIVVAAADVCLHLSLISMQKHNLAVPMYADNSWQETCMH